MTTGGHCRVRVKGQPEWLDAEIALVSKNGASLGLFLDSALTPGLGFMFHAEKGCMVALLLREGGDDWVDVVSGVHCDVEEG